MCVDRHLFIVEVEAWLVGSKVQVCFVEGLYSSDIFPVAVEEIGCNRLGLDDVWNDLLTEVCLIIVEGKLHFLCIEDVDTHRSDIFVFLCPLLLKLLLEAGFWNDVVCDVCIWAWLLEELCDHTLVVTAHDSQSCSFWSADWLSCDCKDCTCVDVALEHLVEVHSVELVSGEDDVVVCILVPEVLQVLSYSISCTLIPGF